MESSRINFGLSSSYEYNYWNGLRQHTSLWTDWISSCNRRPSDHYLNNDCNYIHNCSYPIHHEHNPNYISRFNINNFETNNNSDGRDQHFNNNSIDNGYRHDKHFINYSSSINANRYV